MKIEIDHQELQTILTHMRETKSERSAFDLSMLQIAVPALSKFLDPRTPHVVPDIRQAATGTDEG